MDADALPMRAQSAPAHLLIHVDTKVVPRGGAIESALRRLRDLYSEVTETGATVRISVRIDDLAGNRVFAVEDAGPLIRVALAPGTYQVTARRGEVRRSYTLNLMHGASFDLHVRLTPDRP